MKLSEVVAKWIDAAGIKHVFGVSGGASLHLIHGLHDASTVKFVPTTHECNAGFAADAYARITGFGCAFATSGPGATNLITAIATSYYDSVPVLYITGNVSRQRASRPLGVRQYGFQDAPITDMVRHVAKDVHHLRDPQRVLYMLDLLHYTAKSGRPGPVLLDIPDDLQRTNVDPDTLPRFLPRPEGVLKLDRGIKSFCEAYAKSRRPVLCLGAGARGQVREIAAQFPGVPIATTWGAIDCLEHDDPRMMGGWGTHGVRCANLVVQNCDLVIAVGTRLDTKATGHIPHFAREARIVMVDLDPSEISKFEKLGRKVDVGIGCSAEAFANALAGLGDYDLDRRVRSHWITQCWEWKVRYRDPPARKWKGQDPYALMQEIAKWTSEDDIIVSDTGTALGYLMQGYPFKGERFLHAFNMTPMGYGIPAALGAALASPGKRVVLVTGDGSILMSISELCTTSRWKLPIKVILLDNDGHAMCRQTERQWLGGTYCGTSVQSGLGMPRSWEDLAESMGLDLAFDVEEAITSKRHTFLRVHIDPDAQLIPQAKYGQPLEDADPQLPREEFHATMLVTPL